jgi:predicted unusual protein kinase regulating ubiquinone biosynthesis (AarF/ABC1/UbiB family)
MTNTLSRWWFVTRSISIVAFEGAKFLLHRDRLSTIKNVAKALERNVFYVKLFQAVVGELSALTQEEIDFLNAYTDQVPWTSDDVSDSFRNGIADRGCDLPDDQTVVDISPYPVKSGTMSLVYDGRTKTGEEVVVKVLRHNIEEKVVEAYNDLMTLVRLFEYTRWGREAGIGALLRTNKNALIRQTSLDQELANLLRMRKNFEHVDYIDIPRAYAEYTENDSRVLVMEKVAGRALFDLRDEECEEYANRVASFTLKCIFYDGFYHGDLHAGNIMFHRSEASDEPRLAVIDFGIASGFEEGEQDRFYEFFKASFVDKEHLRAAHYVINECSIVIDALKPAPAKDCIDAAASEIAQHMKEMVDAQRDITPQELALLNRVLSRCNRRLTEGFLRGELAMGSAIGVARALSIRAGKEYITVLMEVVNKMWNPLDGEN